MTVLQALAMHCKQKLSPCIKCRANPNQTEKWGARGVYRSSSTMARVAGYVEEGTGKRTASECYFHNGVASIMMCQWTVCHSTGRKRTLLTSLMANGGMLNLSSSPATLRGKF